MSDVKLIKWDTSQMRLNVPQQNILDNIASSIRRPIPQVSQMEESQDTIALVGGGWSLHDTYEELRALYFAGVKIVALNGAANWLMERNIRPSMMIMLDSRPENLAFLEKPIPRCKYMLASQCHPSLFDACDDRETFIYHVISTDAEAERALLDEHYESRWQQIPGAGTVGIVSIMLCRVLGFRFQHIFGLDSCYAPDGARHHAYAQQLNDAEGSATFIIADRYFTCSAWQASQVENFRRVIQHYGDVLELSIHGDGVLAHILKTGAEIIEQKKEAAE